MLNFNQTLIIAGGCFLMLLSLACCGNVSTPPAYGAKVAYAQHQPLTFPDLTLEFIGSRSVDAAPNYSRGFTFYDFKAQADGPAQNSEAQTYYNKGVTYFAAGLTDDAITNLTQAIALAPAYEEAYQVRGDAYRQQGRFDLARADYEQVLALTAEPERRATVTASLLKTPAGTSQASSPVPPTPSQDRPVNIELGQPFRLKVGQTARLESADFNLLFQTVLDDSRCPRQVNCAEVGQARIMVVL